MRVLHLFDHSVPLHSGYSFRSRQILLGQKRLGWETQQITSGKQGQTGASPEESGGLLFHRTPVSEDGFHPVLSQFKISSDLAAAAGRLVAKFKPDIVHAHSPALVGLAAIRLGRKFNLPVFYEIRAFWEDAAVDLGKSKYGDLRYRLTRGLESYVMKRADGVGCICEGLRLEISARGISHERLSVIPNSVNVSEFPPLDQRDTVLAASTQIGDSPTIGFIGSFYPYEGLDLLIESMPEIIKKIPNIKLLMVGGGMTEQSLHSRVAELGISKSIVFTGRVPHEQVSRYSSLVDLFIFPRKKMRLTDLVTPLKPLEAMSQRKLVAASSVGGHVELIKPDETGFLFAPDDPNAIAQSVVSIMQLPESVRSRILDRALEYVTTERDWNQTSKRYEAAYASAISRKRR